MSRPLRALLPPQKAFARLAVGLLLCFQLIGAAANPASGRVPSEINIQRLADGILGLMSYMVAPDVTTSSMSIENATTANPGLQMLQAGGGFTWSKALPLYLEGNLAYARYDPSFSVPGDDRLIAVNWEALSASGGVGWDFVLAEHWALRPMLNVSLGHVASSLRIPKWWQGQPQQFDAGLDYLESGKLRAAGIGGSLMLDFERYSPEADVDFELRYTHLKLRNSGDFADVVRASASAESASIWARRRAPMGWVALDRPVRYVVDAAYTRFMGSQKEVGVDRIAMLGVGLELDSSARDVWATRWRAMLRYKFGPDISGWSLGVAVSF